MKKTSLAILFSTSLLLVGCSTSSDETTPAVGEYLVNDCAVVAAPVVTDAAPEGLSIDGLIIGGSEIPIISVGPDSAPATELVVSDLTPGNGESVALGNTITVNYCGVGQITGAIFDSSWARGEAATFQLSPGALIEGWTQGVPGMQIGERRLLEIPGELGYGSTPPPGIEPNETLIFIVELMSIDG
ncbi:MAG: FKBP-type peptidyl-prolyl cis-trans isomerase [Candidatus Nanopelagicales bacterium]|nr:FKBP-type peptidyl-prolyl cis-trans isomerase [Candidatus Nanopelagicales bacterium]